MREELISGSRSSVSKRRYFVPDLSPLAHPELARPRPRVVFVAESPHVNEITPERQADRRPLCGMAGRKWWSLLGDILESNPEQDVGLENLLRLCRRHRFAVINAVQYPLDPKISSRYPDADPVKCLGFAKAAGHTSYKKASESGLSDCLRSLRERLESPELAGLPIVCLGNDSEWFVRRALSEEAIEARLFGRIPHPSAWWRNKEFQKRARETLTRVFST